MIGPRKVFVIIIRPRDLALSTCLITLPSKSGNIDIFVGMSMHTLSRSDYHKFCLGNIET